MSTLTPFLPSATFWFSHRTHSPSPSLSSVLAPSLSVCPCAVSRCPRSLRVPPAASGPASAAGHNASESSLPQCLPSAHSSATPRVLSLLCTPFSTQIHLGLCFYFASSFSHPSFPRPSFPLPTSPSLPLTPSSLFFSFPTFSSYHNPLPLVSWV